MRYVLHAAMFCCLVMLCVDAHAQSLKVNDDAVCERVRASGLDDASQYLKAIEQLTPEVPPEEVAFLEKEYASTMAVGDASRFSKLTARPYFYAWRLHFRIDAMRKQLDFANSGLSLSKTPKARIMGVTSAANRAADVAPAWDEYIGSMLGAGTPKDKISDGAYKAGMLPSVLTQYIWCWADKLPGK